MNLKIGIVGTGASLAALTEVLNHLGIIHENFDEKKDYPIIIVSSSEYSKTYMHSNVIYFDEIVPVWKIIEMLEGRANPCLDEPLLNKYELKLLSQIKRIMFELNLPLVRKWFWPHLEDFCCIITHDIDRINIPPNNFMRETPLFRKLLASYIYLYQKKILKITEFPDYIDMILEIEKRYKVTSSFYFFPEYTEKLKFSKIISNLKSQAFEIGLHSNATEEYELRKEIELLEKTYLIKIQGVRKHLLKFNVPSTWLYQEKLLDYDLSFYSNEVFRYCSGLCNPYRPLNTSLIIEIPTSFMDWTALNAKMTYQEMKDKLDNIILTVESYNGCLVVNFHNEYFNKIVYPHIYDLFIHLLEHVQKNYWIATAAECTRWWNKRERAEVNFDFNGDEIIGSCTENIPLIIETSIKEIRIIDSRKFSCKLN